MGAFLQENPDNEMYFSKENSGLGIKIWDCDWRLGLGTRIGIRDRGFGIRIGDWDQGLGIGLGISDWDR